MGFLSWIIWLLFYVLIKRCLTKTIGQQMPLLLDIRILQSSIDDTWTSWVYRGLSLDAVCVIGRLVTFCPPDRFDIDRHVLLSCTRQYFLS